MTKTIIGVFVIMIMLLQTQLWFGKGSIPDLYRLHLQIDNQIQQNALLKDRNQMLAAEIKDLRLGTDGLEELARAKLGMIKKGESFFMIIDRP